MNRVHQTTRTFTTTVLSITFTIGLAPRLLSGASVAVTGSLSNSRAQHSATLLNTGDVLLAGGQAGAGAIATTEIYNVSDGRFSPGPAMAVARLGHTATLLRSGKVLIAGGRLGANALASAEIFDPSTRTFTSTGSLIVARYLHTATLLPSGKVLIAGGSTVASETATAEVYDPDTGLFTATGSLPSPRIHHTANALSTGRVLVAGGSNATSVALASAVLYDESTGTFTSTGSLLAARHSHRATALLTGEILVTGGIDSTESNLASAEIYDASTGVFTSTGSLLSMRSDHLSTLLPSGKVLVVGGEWASPPAELYDRTTGTFTSTSAPATSRTQATATMLPSGSVLMAGGIAGLYGYPAFAELYHPSDGAFTLAGSMTLASRYKHTATLLPTGKVLITGGYGNTEFTFTETHATAELYDPATNTMTPTGTMAETRFHHTATRLTNGKILIVGGQTESGQMTAVCELYDPATGLFTPTGSLSVGRGYHTATLLPSGRVLIAGGMTGTVAILTAGEVYDPGTGTFSPTGNLVQSRVGATATLLKSGKVLLTGGGSGYATSTYFTSAEIYDPTTNTFSRTGDLITARQYHTATLLDTGGVLIAGGVNGRPENRAEVYDPASGVFTPAGTLVTARGVHVAVPMNSGRVLLAGGSNDFCCGGMAAAEIYDPSTGIFTSTGSMAIPRMKATGTLLPSGKVLIVGGDGPQGYQDSAEIFDERLQFSESSRPVLNAIGGGVSQASALTLTGSQFRGPLGDGPDTASGSAQSSATNHPVVRIRRIDNDESTMIPLDTDIPVSSGSATTSREWNVSPGPAMITMFVNGIPSVSEPTTIACGLQISANPISQEVTLGARATFTVSAYAATSYQWQKDMTATGDWRNIDGATAAAYTTPEVAGVDAGSRYRVIVYGTCATLTSSSAILSVEDGQLPAVELIAPTGGEYWLLPSPEETAPAHVVTWRMSDNVRICRVDVSLIYSDDGGVTYHPAPPGGGLPQTFDAGAMCAAPGEATTSHSYTVPATFPSTRSGSLYKIAVTATDQAGNSFTARSPNPFYIVQSNPDSVKTLILTNVARMMSRQGISSSEATTINGKLRELADHPRVQGVVVDLGSITTLSGPSGLYAAWDADPSDPLKANAVLFGPGGIHEHLRTNLLAAYSGVKYVVLVGDDRIIPMARLRDRTVLLPESAYTDLSPTSTTVGRALAAGKYLTDDPLAVLDAVAPEDLDGNLFVPDLAIGRLVETPQEIITTVATYISQDGILDLTKLDPSTGRKVLVTGYDFLTNVSRQIADRWKAFLSPSTVEASLIGGNWGLGSVEARTGALRARLADRYGVMAISGHASHFEEGVPGTDPYDINGLPAADIYGPNGCNSPSEGAVDLAGTVIYAVGCHGGLPVPGSCNDENNSLDLPQTMLARGAVTYIANSGYGWGLKYGIGYGARLTQIFSEEMTGGGTVSVGDAVRETKQRYYLETPRYDAYDEKTVMQWTLFGLPMYAVRTGIVAGSAVSTRAKSGAPGDDELAGAVRVKRSFAGAATENGRLRSATNSLPPSVTQLNLSFDFTGEGVYTKYDSAGTVLPPGPGCPDVNGCYYTLNGLVDRGTGSGDLPIQPYMIYDSRLSGSSQHGVLWKGGTYDEESGWKPIIAELVSNGGDGSNHGSTPRTVMIRPTAPRVVPGVDSPACRPSDLELNSLTVTTGEAIKGADETYSITRRYRNVDLEVFYFNDRSTPTNNCDRTGPAIGAGPFGGEYHQISGSSVSWSVPVSDPSGAWRVLVVYTLNTVDAQNRGMWMPVELTSDGTGIFSGNVSTTGATRVTYVVQAVDNRGNVTWLDYVSAQLPSSGIEHGIPQTVELTFAGPITAPTNVVAAATSTTSVSLTWSPVASATSYDIYRSASGTSYVKVGSSSVTSYTDNTTVANTAYLYAVKAIDAGANASGYSPPDLATTVSFTDPTITPGMTTIKAVHITELRAAVNAVRALAGSGSYPYVDPTITPGVTTAKSAHITDLRTAVAAARSDLSLLPAVYSGSAPDVGLPINAAHITELRGATQ